MRIALLCLVLSACGTEERGAPAPVAHDAAPMFGTEVVRAGTPADEAARTWAQGCATCHGPGAGVGKSPAMPPRADLAQRPDVVAELVERIRGFRR